MITSPVAYTQTEKDLVDQKLSSTSFSNDTWSDVDLSPLKDKIKSHYINVQGNMCPYCQQIIRTTHGRVWDTEHIIPRSHAKNFMFEPLNLCACCIDCNVAKGDKKITNSRAQRRLPIRSQDYFIVHPHLDLYHDNILVIRAGFYYVALEEKGQKTIEICELNRFYEFAKFDSSVCGDDRIFLLSDELRKVTDDRQKYAIRNEIAFIAIQGNRQNT